MTELCHDAVGRTRMARLDLKRARERRLDALLEALWQDTRNPREQAELEHHFRIRDEDRELAALTAAAMF